MADLFWLSDQQWALIEPLLPRLGGKPRVDDRRVISGILHRFREGLRWRAVTGRVWPSHDAVQPLQSLEQTRPVAADIRGSGRQRRAAARGHGR